jgi:hypothetical protein
VRAAAIAGVFAGIAATLIEIALWWLHGDAVIATLVRDTRFAAAIVLGPDVLRSAMDATMLAVATLVHVALSIAYGVALAPLVARLRPSLSLLVGALFGIALYVVNLHGFTLVYPWFEQARGVVTLAAHVSFGASGALAYRALAPRLSSPGNGSAPPASPRDARPRTHGARRARIPRKRG